MVHRGTGGEVQKIARVKYTKGFQDGVADDNAALYPALHLRVGLLLAYVRCIKEATVKQQVGLEQLSMQPQHTRHHGKVLQQVS